MSDIQSAVVGTLAAGATRFFAVDFAGQLDDGELLTGTPTVVEVTTANLTLSNKAVNTEELTINGSTVAIGEAVQFTATGAVAGTTYTIKITVSTDAGQTLVGKVVVKGE